MPDPTPDAFSHFDLSTLSKPDSYKLLASVVMPRPIAWVVSRDTAGTINAAPFSFFNIASADPPVAMISFAGPPDREVKDTLANIRARGEFVINMVPEELAQAMNLTAINAPAGTDEAALAGLELIPCTLVDIPRIAASPVAFECHLLETLNFGGASTLCLGRILQVHIRTSAFADLARLHIDPGQLRLIGRMGGAGVYTTTRDRFNIDRLTWPLQKPPLK
jgi:flavin reductase (DIM6/NTAB) family NADH-FMN oxidoreductase RutF